MDLHEAIKVRHSVRSYTDQKIEGEVKQALQKAVDDCNKESGLNIQLCLDEPKAFDSMMARYGKFENCKNYIALIGNGASEEAYGYFGEKVVLIAQQLGLNTCWVAMTYKKSQAPVKLNPGEKLRIVIALGYGKTSGVVRKSKEMLQLCKVDGEMQDWFKKGMEAALLAPTAMNQQKFMLVQSENKVIAKPLTAFYAKMDLGIVKYHFEIGAGIDNFHWEK